MDDAQPAPAQAGPDSPVALEDTPGGKLVFAWFNENVANSEATRWPPATNHLLSVMPLLIEGVNALVQQKG
jgi:hypothetical protein